MRDAAELLRSRILIVDNQEVNVRLLEQMLDGAGYVAVTSTLELSEVSQLHRQNRYDLILLDLQMPGMDGFQVMESLQAIAPGETLPVLVITAQPDYKLRAIKAGAQDFISKPFNGAELLRRVHSILASRPGATAAARDPASPERKFAPFELTPRTFAWVGGCLAAAWLISQLWKIGLIVVVSLVWVGTFNPIIKSIEARGLTRRKAIFLLMASLGLVAAILLVLLAPVLSNQLTTIVNELPAQRERLVTLLGERTFTSPVSHALANVDLDESYQRLQSYLVRYWSDVLLVIGYGITTISLSIYFLADGKRTQGALFAVIPRPYHMRLARIVHSLGRIVGGYMRGQLITSMSIATFTFLFLLACGVDHALALALFAALMDLIPFVGGFLAIVPSTLTALGHGPNTALVVLVGLWLYQQFENKLLIPHIYGQLLRLSPATVILALMAGWTLLGVLGALLALPIAAGLQMILEELGVALPGDDSEDLSALAREKKTEAAYALMSAGSSAPDAGQIATELATGLRDADAWVAARDARKKRAEAGRRP